MLPANKRDKGMVFQAYSLCPHMAARQKHRVRASAAPRAPNPAACQGHPLLLAAGHLVGVSLGLCREAHEVEHVTGPGTPLGLGPAVQPKPELDVSAAQPCVGRGCRLGTPSPCRVCWRGAW